MSLNLFSLDGRVALVTGGNGGLGRAMARGLAAAGARVLVTGRSDAKNSDVASEFGAEHVISLDVRDEPAVERAIAGIAGRFGRLDVLVNNAGVFRGGSALELSREAWDDVLATHLTGAFLCAKHAGRSMVERGKGGKIVNVGSMYSLFGAPSFADYAAAKAGILGLTRSLAVEFGKARIQVNAILPGWYETDLTRGLPAKPMGEQIRRRTPARRWGDPEDLIGTVVYLASAASDFVTGAHIPVDGGYHVADRIMDD
jgi:2-dehydro-3-deoxy-D-gluconate 5-dehydrogenase